MSTVRETSRNIYVRWDDNAKRRFAIAWKYGVEIRDLQDRFCMSYETVVKTAADLHLKPRGNNSTRGWHEPDRFLYR